MTHPPNPPLPSSSGTPVHPASPSPGCPFAHQPRGSTRGWVILGCGVAAIVGAFLPWASVVGPFLCAANVSGMDGNVGWIVVGLGIALISYGGALLRGQASRVLAVVAGVASIGLIAISFWKTGDLSERERAIYQKLARLAADDVLGIQLAVSQSFQMRMGVGLRLITMAGLVAAITIVSMLAARRRAARHTTPALSSGYPSA